MNYDLKLFKSHYGKLYFRLMYWGLGFALLFLQLSYYPSFFHWNVSTNFIGVCATVTCLLLVIIVPVSGFLYFDCKRRAMNQQQWIDHNSVFYRVEQRKMFSLVSSKLHTYTYEIQKSKDSTMDDRYFYVKGSITMIDETEDSKNVIYINEIKIPRCFNNEEKMMRALKIK